MDCAEKPCPENRPFRCKDGACVFASFCDGIHDCSDASDEENCTEYIEPEYVPSSEPSPSAAAPVEEDANVHESAVEPEPSPEVEPEPDSEFEHPSEPESEPEPSVDDTKDMLEVFDEVETPVSPAASSDMSAGGADSILRSEYSPLLVLIFSYFLLMR